MPGARFDSASWTDSTGNLWLSGGNGSGDDYGYLNDLWRYDIATGMWTWMSGAETADQVGNFGTRGVPDAHNVPGARQYSVSWTDSVGNLWLFGGSVKVGTNINGQLNDLWRYEVPQCVTGSDCAGGYECVEGECEIRRQASRNRRRPVSGSWQVAGVAELR